MSHFYSDIRPWGGTTWLDHHVCEASRGIKNYINESIFVFFRRPFLVIVLDCFNSIDLVDDFYQRIRLTQQKLIVGRVTDKSQLTDNDLW